MPVFRLNERLAFPRPELAEDGLLAVGGDLSPERLLLAYSSGIFPWYEEGVPILWHSPDPRMVLLASQYHEPRSLRKAARKRGYELRMDTAFGEVIQACADSPRPGQDGTWITEDMADAYEELHRLGFAHSIETYQAGELVGGLYGVSLGAAFFGESMFARAPDASKIAFAAALRQFIQWGLELVDCQVHTEHLERFGAELWPRTRYLDELARALESPTRRGRWRFDDVEI
jgi:leucyl/phenylalanyl-tRNA--protein transferase